MNPRDLHLLSLAKQHVEEVVSQVDETLETEWRKENITLLDNLSTCLEDIHDQLDEAISILKNLKK